MGVSHPIKADDLTPEHQNKIIDYLKTEFKYLSEEEQRKVAIDICIATARKPTKDEEDNFNKLLEEFKLENKL